MASSEPDASESRSAYNDLRRLTPSLAAELDHLRASLREHNLWLQQYGRSNDDAASLASVPSGPMVTVSSVPAYETTTQTHLPTFRPSESDPLPPIPPHPETTETPETATAESAVLESIITPPSGAAPSYSSSSTMANSSTPTTTTNNVNDSDFSSGNPPPYAASDVPLYSSAVRDDVVQRRDQLIEWLREGEEVLRDYSARFAQLAAELQLPAEDVLGTWSEAAPDNTLPDYTMIERREELMVGGVGEVPPVYVRTPVPGR